MREVNGMGKPGVMIYFGDAELLSALSDDDRGRMFQAIIEYSRDGILPDFSAYPGLSGLWIVFQRAVDADSKRYADICAKKSYAAYCRKMKADGLNPAPFDEWRHAIADDITCNQMISDDITCNQMISDVTNNQLPITNNQFPNTNYQIPNNLSKKEEKEERKIEQQLKAEYEAAFGGGPSDLREWNYLIRTYGADIVRQAMQEAKEKGMTQYAAWAYVSTRIKFSDD